MMASPTGKVHDPMYAFDTHFPERLSRLHLHGDFNLSGSFRKKKNRAQRSGARYKTQPVTFDEIKEVDEEPTSATAESKGVKESGAEQLKGQLQAFSRSMDGLLPKSSASEHPAAFQHHISHSRSGSRKFHRHPDCIPERVDLEQQPPSPQPETHQNRLLSDIKPAATTVPSSSQQVASLSVVSLAPPGTSGESSTDVPSVSPVPSPNIGPRRQKVTAKAKKRQKAQEEGGIS